MSELKTETLCLMPILGCLDAFLNFPQSTLSLARKTRSTDWKTINDTQEEFINSFWQFRDKLKQVKELRSKADFKVEVINEWLKEEGFDIQLEKRDGERISVASILKVLEEWQIKGTKRDIFSRNTKKSYPGALLKEGFRVYSDVKIHPNPVVHVHAKNDDNVCMSIVDKVPQSKFGLYELTTKLNGVKKETHDFTRITFPMIDLDMKPDISWLCGMNIDKRFDNWVIDQALQQTKFRMNEKGAKVESGVAIQLYDCG